MARRSQVNYVDEEVELNMTPMLDVVFILLIFFIVTAVFVREPGVEIIRPETRTLELRNPSILVAVTKNDEVWISKKLYRINEVASVIEDMRDENPKAEVVIQGDQKAKVGTVLDIQEICQNLDIPVYISSDEKR